VRPAFRPLSAQSAFSGMPTRRGSAQSRGSLPARTSGLELKRSAEQSAPRASTTRVNRQPEHIHAQHSRAVPEDRRCIPGDDNLSYGAAARSTRRHRASGADANRPRPSEGDATGRNPDVTTPVGVRRCWLLLLVLASFSGRRLLNARLSCFRPRPRKLSGSQWPGGGLQVVFGADPRSRCSRRIALVSTLPGDESWGCWSVRSDRGSG
jgi:hypothetical protein